MICMQEDGIPMHCSFQEQTQIAFTAVPLSHGRLN
jgi:hypothetical protein